jgi:hypothetical protein
MQVPLTGCGIFFNEWADDQRSENFFVLSTERVMGKTRIQHTMTMIEPMRHVISDEREAI